MAKIFLCLRGALLQSQKKALCTLLAQSEVNAVNSSQCFLFNGGLKQLEIYLIKVRLWCIAVECKVATIYSTRCHFSLGWKYLAAAICCENPSIHILNYGTCFLNKPLLSYLIVSGILFEKVVSCAVDN